MAREFSDAIIAHGNVRKCPKQGTLDSLLDRHHAQARLRRTSGAGNAALIQQPGLLMRFISMGKFRKLLSRIRNRLFYSFSRPASGPSFRLEKAITHKGETTISPKRRLHWQSAALT